MWRPRQHWRARRAIALMEANRWPEVLPVAASIERSGDMDIRRLALTLSSCALEIVDDHHGALGRRAALVAIDGSPAHAYDYVRLADLQTTIGRYADAEANARHGYRIAEGQADESVLRADALRQEASIAYYRGDLADSWRLLGNARQLGLDRLDAINDLMMEAYLEDAAGRRLEAIGKVEHVVRLREQLHVEAQSGTGVAPSAAIVGLAGTLMEHARLSAASGAVGPARASLLAAEQHVSRFEWPRPRVMLRLSLAQAATATAEGRSDAAVERAEDALTAARQLRLPNEIAMAHQAAACAYARSNAGDDADRHRDAAHEIYAGLGRALAARDTAR